MSVGAFFLIFGSVAFSFAIEAALGFGATLIALALGVLWIDARILLPPLVFWNLVLSLCLWWKGRKKVHWGWILKEVTPWMLLGLPVGVFGFRMLPSSLLVRIFGGLVLMLSAMGIWESLQGGRSKAMPPLGASLLLALGGAVHGAFATGGPMVVYVASRRLGEKDTYRASLSALWALLNGLVVLGHLWAGAWGWASLGIFLVMAPGVMLGLVVGDWLHKHIPLERFRLLVQAGLALVGLWLGIRG